MAEATATQTDEQELLAYHDKLDAYIKQIDELRDKNTIEDLQAAVHVIEEAFNAGNDDLYKTLKVGRACFVRKSISELLKITKTTELRKFVKKYRGNLNRILRIAKTFFPAKKATVAEEPAPITPPPAEPVPEPTAETPAELPTNNEDLQAKALELLDKGDAQGTVKLIASYFTSIDIPEGDMVKGFQKDKAIKMLYNPPEEDKIIDFLKNLTPQPPVPMPAPEPKAPVAPEPTIESVFSGPKSLIDIKRNAKLRMKDGAVKEGLQDLIEGLKTLDAYKNKFGEAVIKSGEGLLSKESALDQDRVISWIDTLKDSPGPPSAIKQSKPKTGPEAKPQAPAEPKPKAETKETEFGWDEAYEAVDKEPDSTADLLVMTIRIMMRIKMGATGMGKEFYADRNKYFGIDNDLPVPEQLEISRKIMSAVTEAKNPFLEAVFSAKVGFDNKKILKKILKTNGVPENAEETKNKVKEALRQVKEIINKAKAEVVKPADKPPKAEPKPKAEPAPKPKDKPKAEPAPKAPPAPAEMPKDVPDNIRIAIEEKIKGNKDNLRRFVLAWRFYKGEAVNLNLNDDDEKHVKTILGALEGIKSDASDVQNTMKKPFIRLFIILDKIPGEEAEKAMKDKEEHEKFKIFFDEICVLNGDLEKQIAELFEILELNPNNFSNPTHQRLLSQLKDEIRDVLFVNNVPKAMGMSADASREDKLSVIEKMSFREKIQKAKDIKKSIDDDPELPDMLEVYRNKIKPTKKGVKPPESSKPDIKAPPSDQTTEGSAVGTAPGPSADDEKKKRDDEEKKKAEEEKRKKEKEKKGKEKKSDESKEKVSGISDGDIEKFMAEILREGSDYIVKGGSKDPTSLAIRQLIKEKIGSDGIDDLKHFLQKPKVELTKEAKEYKRDNTIKQLEALIKEQKSEIDDLTQRAKKRTLSDEDLKKILTTKREEVNKKEHMELALSSMNEKVQYKTPLQVLTMINFYIEKGDSDEKSSYLDVTILKQAEEQIDKERKKISGSFSHKAINFLTFGLIKPTLKGILKVLGTREDALKKIGKEKMEELAGADDVKEVKAWLNSLEGGRERAYSEVAPLLIAYLEMALRSGRMSHINIVSMGAAEDLLKHLKAARMDHYANEVEGKTGNEIDLMNEYFGKMNKSMSVEKEISEKILSDPTNWRLATGAVGTGAIGAAALAGGPLGLGIGFGVLTAGALARSFGKDLDDETKKLVRRGTIRSLVAGTLATGIAALGGGFIAIPLMGLTGLFSPELFKHRKKIKEKAKIAAPHVKKGGMIGLKIIPKLVLVPLLSYGLITKKGRARLWKTIKW